MKARIIQKKTAKEFFNPSSVQGQHGGGDEWGFLDMG